MRSLSSRPRRRAAAAVAILLAFGQGPPASGHEWYPPDCCSGIDCAPVRGEVDVTATDRGWRINATGEILPYGDERIRATPVDAQDDFHRCSVAGAATGRTICLFVPQYGS